MKRTISIMITFIILVQLCMPILMQYEIQAETINNLNGTYTQTQTPENYTIKYEYNYIENIVTECKVTIQGIIMSVPDGWLAADISRSSIYKVFYENGSETVTTDYLESEVNIEVSEIGYVLANIIFNDTNLYNGIVANLGDYILEKDDTAKQMLVKNVSNITAIDFERMDITDLTGIEKFTGLKRLGLWNNKIEDITVLNNNTNIEELYLWDNLLENDDLQVLATMTNLKTLDIGLNNITDISSIYSSASIENIYARWNSIKDLTGIDQMSTLKLLDVQGNKIKKIPELNNIEDANLNIKDQLYTATIIDKGQGQVEISIPEVFTKALDANSRYYTEEGLNLENCELSEDKTKIMVNSEDVFETNAKAEIKSGVLEGTVFFVYGVGIRYYINITEQKLESIDLDVNSDGEVTLEDTVTMKEYIDGASYTEEEYENFMKEFEKFIHIDVDGNQEINNIDYNRFVKYINKETDILFTGMIDTNYDRAEDIIAQIHTYNPNINLNDEMYIFTENGEKEITFIDENGEEQILIASVNCIDRTALGYEINYSTQDLTNSDVIVTITADEEVEDIYENEEEGWVLLEDKITLQKTYVENGEEIVVLADEAGNYTEIEVKVENISKNAPESGKLIIKKQNESGEDYVENTWTNHDIYIAIDEANKPENTTMKYTINGQEYTGSQTLTQDGEYEVILTTQDLVGNSTNVTYHVKIDKTAPEVGNLYLKLESSIGEELQNNVITGKNVYVNLEDATDNLSGIAENYYILNSNTEDKLTGSEIYRNNGNYELKVVTIDKAGNRVEQDYSFTIDKSAPTLQVDYSTTEETQESVTVTITSDKEIKSVEDWELSEDKKVLVKTFTENTDQIIIVEDLLGNQTEVHIQINNIVKKQEIRDDIYEITEDNYVLGIEPGTLMQTCLENLGIYEEIEYDDIVKTGDSITIDGTTYILIVVGDITQDGYFDIQDLSNLCYHIAGTQILTGVYLLAADMNLNIDVDMIDLSTMCSKIAGLN